MDRPVFSHSVPLRLVTLRKRWQFLKAAAEGRKFIMPAFVLQARARAESEMDAAPISDRNAIAIGVTATKKLGGAVVRNRAKRRLREIARNILPGSGKSGHDYVLIAREKALTQDFDSLTQDLAKALQRIHSENYRPPAPPRHASRAAASRRKPAS